MLRGLDLRLYPGDRVALMGRNGAGKSTLLRLAKGLAEPTRGRIERAGEVALLLQNPGDYLIHEHAVDDAGARGVAAAGLAGREQANPRDLSGGERQRLALEVVLAGEAPAAVLLDEPTRGMDRVHKDALAARIHQLAESGAAVVVATHDTEFAASFADRIVLLGQGVAIADGPTVRRARRRQAFLDRGGARDGRRGPAPRGGGAADRAGGGDGVTWQLASLLVLGLGLAAGFAWYERDKPPARVLALVATLAALAVVGRLAFAAFPNVKPTTDIVLFAGYALGAVPGFVVGAIAALVSNIFLSQGPWTPWQMAAWGGVGVGGALLARALRGREPNRFLLAAVCGVAGLAFGAWMDLYQLDAGRAPGPRHVPGHLGDLAALQHRPRRRERRLLAADRACVHPRAAALQAPASRCAGWSRRRPPWRSSPCLRPRPPRPRRAGRRAGSSRRRTATAASAPRPGQASSRLYSGWTALGLAAAGRNSRDVKRHGGRSLAAYEQRSQRSVSDIGEVERTVLVATAAGLSPRDFAGKDLIAVIQRRRRGDGSIAGYVSYTTFGVLALRSAHVSPGKATVAWLVGSANADGGFGVARASASDSDMTGAAVQALAVVGRRKAAVTQRAVAWLRANQNDDGGFGQFRGRSSNAQSTAYAVQGLVAAGAGGATLSRALGYLRGLQRSDGSVRYSSTSSQTPVWVTAQALMALERKPLPIAAVARAKPRRSHHAAAKAAPAKPGAAKHHEAEGAGARARAGGRSGAGAAPRRSAAAVWGFQPSHRPGERQQLRVGPDRPFGSWRLRWPGRWLCSFCCGAASSRAAGAAEPRRPDPRTHR